MDSHTNIVVTLGFFNRLIYWKCKCQIPYKYTINNYNEIFNDVELSYVMNRTVLYSDIDVNQHLNNSRYFEWAFDAIPVEFFKDIYIK